MSKTPVQFRLNGSEKAVFVEGGQNLLATLRRDIGDFAPKYGCGQGTCGVCTVLIDGEPHLSCLTLAEAAAGRSVDTRDPQGTELTLADTTVTVSVLAGLDDSLLGYAEDA